MLTVMNDTGFGYPEISYYYNDFFLKEIDNSTDY